MKRHVLYGLGIAAAVVAAAVPTILATPAIKTLVENHPAVAFYVPVVTGIVSALAKAFRESRTAAAPKQ